MERKLRIVIVLALLAIWVTACAPAPAAPAATSPAVQATHAVTQTASTPSTQPANALTQTVASPSTQPANTQIQTGTAPSAAPTQADVTIDNFAFSPAMLTVKVGTTVRWTNQQGVQHTVTSDTNMWDSGRLSQGQSFEQTFTQAGTFAYHCSIHSSMKGTITVTQ